MGSGRATDAELKEVLARFGRGDTTEALRLGQDLVTRAVLDGTAHALLADLWLARRDLSDVAIIESYAARVLDPAFPPVWRRWATVQAQHYRYPQAYASLERYFQLGGETAQRDAAAQDFRRELQLRLPGGAIAQRQIGQHLEQLREKGD